MKKLGISVFALMIGLPTLANAAVQSPAGVTVDTAKHVAATSFVQGAYNALAGVARDHATQIDANTTAIAGKQDALTTAQQNAVDSGITAAKVATYDGYATTIAGKQDALTTAQQDAVDSGITAAKVAAYDAAAAKQVEVYTTWNTSATGKAAALVDPD